MATEYGAMQVQAQTYWNHARRLQGEGQFIEAAQAYLAVLQFKPASWAASYNLGLVYQELGRLEEARDAYRRTIQLNPSLAQAHNNLGNVFQGLKQDDAALEAYARAIEFDPAIAQAHYNSAQILQATGRLTDSVESLKRTVELDAANDDAWENLFSLLFGLKRKSEAIETFYRWEQATPPCLWRLTAGLLVSRYTGDRALEERYLAQLKDWPFPRYAPRELTLVLGNLQYFDLPPDVLLACYERFNRAMNAQRKMPVAMLPNRSPGKMRIGYMSPDFRHHVMGRIMLDILHQHDRSRFDIFLISTCDSHFHDETTQKFRALAQGFADIHELGDLAAAQVIAEVDLDVLVDLAGHTLANRTGVIAHRPARHIVTHLGYHGCIGLDAVEYKFTDHFADTAESVRVQIEKPYYLNCCVMPFSHPDSSTENYSRNALRHDLGVTDKFVFATFVNPMKLSPRCLATWKRVLDAAPSAVLAFSPYDLSDRPLILAILGAAEILPERVVFIDVQNDVAGQRARYLAVDAALDTFPYAGGDTTLAALDMNVPVVSLVGSRHSERIGYSILSNLGVTDTIAFSEDAFVDIATRLVLDRPWFDDLRARIESAMQASPLTRIAVHTKALEDAYVDIATIDVLPSGRLAAKEFFPQFKAALKAHRDAGNAAERDSACLRYDHLLADQPRFGPALYARGMLAQELGRLQEAVDYLVQAIEASPEDEPARIALAALLLDQGEATRAIDCLAPALTEESRNAKAHRLAAEAYLRNENWQEATTMAERAVALTPTDIQAVFTAGVALSHTSGGVDALTMYNRVLSLDNSHVGAAYNAALLLQEHGDFHSAESLLRRILRTDRQNESAHWRLGELLLKLGRIEDAVKHAKEFSRACPKSFKAQFRTAQAAVYEGKLEAAATLLRELAMSVMAEPATSDSEELLRVVLDLGVNLDFADELISQLTHRSVEVTKALFSSPKPGPTTRQSGQIRIGYLSADCHGTDTGLMLLEILRRHDKSAYKIHVYALDGQTDDVTQEIVGAVDSFTAIYSWTPDRSAAWIQEHALDLLVDLTSLRDEKSSAIVAMCRARATVLYPLQAPYPCKAADFRLTDQVSELPHATDAFPAVPVVMSDTIFPWVAAVTGKAAVARSDADRPFVFGVRAPPELISQRCVTIWKTLLARAPSAVILLIPALQGQIWALRQILETAGIEPSRIKTIPGIADEAMDRFLRADAILDTMPTSHVSSVLYALAGGTPVITQSGRLPGERSGTSILSSLGLNDMLANSGAHYIDLATRLVEDKNWRSELVARMNQCLVDSRPTNPGQFILEYETALAAICEKSQGQPGAH